MRLVAVILIATTLGLSRPSVCASMIFDLNSDWSIATNPFGGVWSLNAGTLPLSFVSDLSTTGIDTWATPQPGWSARFLNPINEIIPAWFKANATFTGVAAGSIDWQSGDVVVHTSGNPSAQSILTWASPMDGVIDVSGSVWAARNISRSNDWTLILENSGGSSVLSQGSVFDGDAFDRENPFNFILGTDDPTTLLGIPVAAGDVLQLHLGSATSSADYVGMNMNVTVTETIPEPSTYVTFAIITLSVAGVQCWRRRRQFKQG